MQIIRTMRRQTALYWSRSNRKDEFGEYTFDDPVSIKCRWEQKQTLVLNKEGEEVISGDTVYVDRKMKSGDRLMGPFNKKENPFGFIDSPLPPDTNSKEIIVLEIFPTLQATTDLFIARL